MKKILVLFLIGLVSCKQRADFDPRFPARPGTVPLTTCDGTPIEWTWEDQRALNEGRLFLEKKGDCVIAIVIKKD